MAKLVIKVTLSKKYFNAIVKNDYTGLNDFDKSIINNTLLQYGVLFADCKKVYSINDSDYVYEF